MPWVRGFFISVTQTVAGIAAAALTSALFPGPLNVKTKLGGGTSIAQGLFIEMFLTALLVLTVLLLAAERHKSTFLAPIGVGLSLFVAEMAGNSYLSSFAKTTCLLPQEFISRGHRSTLLGRSGHVLFFANLKGITGYTGSAHFWVLSWLRLSTSF